MAERKTDEEIAREMVAENDPMLAQEPEIEDEIDSIESVDAVAELKRERDEMRDRFMRALADAENTRKRAERDRRESENYGLERALMMATEDGKDGDKALLEGVELTMRELRNVFKKHGVEVIRPEIGERFDPQLHEAMFEAPLPGTKAGDIIQVSASGFMLHDRLLRPAQVGVSSTPAS